MPIEVPRAVIREIELINKGKKRIYERKKNKPVTKEELIGKVSANVEILNEIASSELINSYLIKFDHITIIQDVGSIVIANVNNNPGCYLWYDSHYPADRCTNDYRFVTSILIENWHTGSLKMVADLTEKEIWRIILTWLRRHREMLKP